MPENAIAFKVHNDTGHKAFCRVSRHNPGILMLTEPGILGVS